MLVIYLAAPIDQARNSYSLEWTIWRDEFQSRLLQRTQDVAVFRPDRAWSVRSDHADPRLEINNRAALDYADAVVALLPKGVPTIGVPREIEAARQAGIPVLAVTDLERSFSLADVDQLPISLASIDDAIDWVQKQGRGGAGDVQAQLHFSPIRPGPHWLPTRAYDGDAGFDLYASEAVVVPVGKAADVPTNIRVALPDGVWARVVGRSSTLRSRGLIAVEGIIDTGWRGELFAGVQNVGEHAVTILPGERISQLILAPNLAPAFTPNLHPDISQIPPVDDRGTAGFGSTGS